MVPSGGYQRLFFVPVDAKSPGKNVRAQKSIRTHVMLDRQRKRRLADMENHSRRIARKPVPGESEPTSIDGETSSMIISRSPGTNALEKSQSASSDESNNAQSVYPFGGRSYELHTEREVLGLLEKPMLTCEVAPQQVVFKYIWFWHGDHIERLCGHRSNDKSPRNPNQWLSIVDMNEALTYGQAYSADAHLLFTKSQSVPVQENRFGFKAKAIAHINQNIENLKGGIDDGTIAAVLAMASGAFWEYRSRAEFSVHLNGLRKMVQLKGGLAGIESALLRDLLTLFELYPAILYRMKPQFPINRRKLPLRLPYLPSSPLATCMTNPLMSFGGFAHVFKTLSFKPTILQLLQDMHDLTLILEAHQFPISDDQICQSATKRAQISDRLLALSAKQVQAFASASAEECDKDPDPILTATLLTSIIYLRALIYLVPFRDPVNARIAHALRLSLSASMAAGHWHQLPGLLIWVLLVGGASVLDQQMAISTSGNERRVQGSDFPFFSGHLMGEGIAVSVMYLEEMHHLLLRFLWLVNLLERVPKFGYGGSGTGEVGEGDKGPGPAMFDFLVSRDLYGRVRMWGGGSNSS